jgi:hypothetical protein
MRSVIQKGAIALGLAGALALASGQAAQAASIPSQTLAVKAAAPDSTTDVRWRGGWGPGIGFGIAAGALTGAAIAGSYPYWGGGPYWGGYPAYSYYGGDPYYYRPHWRHRRVVYVHRRPWRRHYAYWGGPSYRHAYWGGGPYYGW